MSTVAMTQDNFSELVGREGILLVDFWAAWCGPCRAFGPIFEAASLRHPDITWAKVDTEAEGALAGALHIRSIPTLMVFRDGVLLYAEAGMMPGPALDELVTKVRALDMEEVRRAVATAKVA
jgi:thioredoxin 1